MWPFQKHKALPSAIVDTRPDPRYAGSVIAANGGPNSGKTYLVSKLIFTAGFKYRLPIILQDTRGDLRVYHEAAIKTLEGMSDTQSRLKLEYLRDKTRCRIVSDRGSSQFLAILEAYAKQSEKEVNRTAKAYVLMDEGGVLRRGDEDAWDIASGFRNSGITGFTTVHKDTDISRVGRQCLRVVILQRPYEGEVEFFGQTIPAMECSAPMSNIVTYIDSFDRTVKRFDMTKEPIPEIMIHPVQPTKVKELTF